MSQTILPSILVRSLIPMFNRFWFQVTHVLVGLVPSNFMASTLHLKSPISHQVKPNLADKTILRLIHGLESIHQTSLEATNAFRRFPRFSVVIFPQGKADQLAGEGPFWRKRMEDSGTKNMKQKEYKLTQHLLWQLYIAWRFLTI